MIIELYPAGAFQTNCYIVGDEATKEGIVIDPGADAEGIIRLVKRHGLDVKYIILTHGHGDHVGAVSEVKEATGARVIMHVGDTYLTDGGNAEIFPMFRSIKPFKVDEYVKQGDALSFGGFVVEIIETPGHTPGGISLRIGDSLFSGDTLFQGSVGRTDFPKGSHTQLIESITTKLMVLSEETAVYPGHGPGTTIGREKRYNPFL